MKRLFITLICFLLITTFSGFNIKADSSYYIDLGSAIYDSDSKNYFTFPDTKVTLNGSNPSILSITVSSGSLTVPNGTDVQGATTVYDLESGGTHKSVTFIWNDGPSEDSIKEIIKAIQFQYVDGMTVTVTLNGNKTETPIQEGATLTQWSVNKHYYLYVPHIPINGDASSFIAWSEAYNAALSYTLGGMKGYLATITLQGEQDYLANLATDNVWVGATSLLQSDGSKINGETLQINETSKLKYQDGYNTTANDYELNTGSYPSSPITKYYYWAAGPESGQKIIKGDYISSEDVITLYDIGSVRKELTAFNTETASIPKPNNVEYIDGTRGQYENCTAVYAGGNAVGFNDIPEGNWNAAGEIYASAMGYIVEFGDWNDKDNVDPSKVFSFDVVLKDEEKPKVEVDGDVDFDPMNKQYDGTSLNKDNIENVIYDGNSFSADNFTVEWYDLNENEIEAPVNVGNYKVKVLVNTDDSIVVSDFKEIEITKRNLTVKANDINVKVNDTYDYSYRISEGSLVDGDVLNVVFDTTKPTSAGTYPISILFASVNDNYEVKALAGILTISKEETKKSNNVIKKTHLTCEQAVGENWTWSEATQSCVLKVKVSDGYVVPNTAVK